MSTIKRIAAILASVVDKSEIKVVISNKSKAKGIIFAKKSKIKVKIFKFNHMDDKKILQFLKKKQIKLICLAGFMKILTKKFIQKFEGKILNINRDDKEFYNYIGSFGFFGIILEAKIKTKKIV